MFFIMLLAKSPTRFFVHVWSICLSILIYLVGDFNPSENISQLGLLFPIDGKS